ncbi:hypothetical protein R1sor_011387 [Riccia sorocarpa]|uniref:Uncharacterized protein n=1 Tax=Riccia sorocarpa TaxID=122646 RepID=A0ABD3I1W2_9MARC
MERKSHKEVISLVCCSDATSDAFEQFVLRWKKGEVPDVHGALGKPKGERDVGEVDRDFSQLSVNRFRPVNGLVDEDLKPVWNQLEKGSVWVSRPAKHQGHDDIVTLRDYCKVLKGKRTWGKTILATDYSIPDKWLEEMLKFVPDKPEKEVVTEDVSSSDGDDEDSSKKKKKKKKSTSVDVIPSQIKTQLYKFHCAKHGGDIPQRLQPWEVLEIKDITQYQLTIDEKLNCKLVFLDLIHPDMVAWEKQEFSSFLGIIGELTNAKEFAIVAVMEFGQPLVDFRAALKKMKDARFLMECGCYERPRLQRKVALEYPCWQLVYAFVSLGAEDYRPKLHENIQCQPFLSEYVTKKSTEDFDVAKGEGALAENIKNKVPRWEFVNLSSPDGKPLVHPICKRRNFCIRLLTNLSADGSTVLDFFSGGQVSASANQQLAVAFSSQQPALASSSRQPADAVTQEDQIASQTAPAPFVFDDEMQKEALENLGNARRRVDFNPTSN